MKHLRSRFAGLIFAAVGIVLLLGAQTTHAEDRQLQTAIFAGGCFWCVESDFDVVPGVVETTSGYTGGTLDNPTYGQVGSGGTGHLEAVQITFDANEVSYSELLRIFWRSIDPTDAGGQFCDRGETYTTAIFTHDDNQAWEAAQSKTAIEEARLLDRPIATVIRPAQLFWPAEDYHQDYHNKNPFRYKFYRLSCGRDRRVKGLWGEDAWGGMAHGS